VFGARFVLDHSTAFVLDFDSLDVGELQTPYRMIGVQEIE